MDLVDDIPPDVIVKMTAPMLRAFLALHCDPQCHSCLRSIRVDMEFKLAFVPKTKQIWVSLDEYMPHQKTPMRVSDGGTDEMLCILCTPATLKVNLAHRRTQLAKFHRAQGGGFTREHRG